MKALRKFALPLFGICVAALPFLAKAQSAQSQIQSEMTISELGEGEYWFSFLGHSRPNPILVVTKRDENDVRRVTPIRIEAHGCDGGPIIFTERHFREVRGKFTGNIMAKGGTGPYCRTENLTITFFQLVTNADGYAFIEAYYTTRRFGRLRFVRSEEMISIVNPVDELPR